MFIGSLSTREIMIAMCSEVDRRVQLFQMSCLYTADDNAIRGLVYVAIGENLSEWGTR